jgi:cytochrome P450
MGTSSVATIPQYPMARAAGCPFDPPPALRVRAPISPVRLWDGTIPWLVTRHADVRALLGDQRVSADSRREGDPHAGAGGRARRTRGSTFISMDDAEHARLRKMVTRTFAIRRVEALRQSIQRIVDERIPGLRLAAGLDEIAFQHESNVDGVYELPVTW